MQKSSICAKIGGVANPKVVITMTAHEDDSKDALSVFEFFEMLSDERAAIEFIESTR